MAYKNGVGKELIQWDWIFFAALISIAFCGYIYYATQRDCRCNPILQPQKRECWCGNINVGFWNDRCEDVCDNIKATINNVTANSFSSVREKNVSGCLHPNTVYDNGQVVKYECGGEVREER